MKPVRVDSSEHSHVVHCTQHPWFRAGATSKAEGERLGARHMLEQHDDDRNARRNAQQTARRRGVKRAKA